MGLPDVHVAKVTTPEIYLSIEKISRGKGEFLGLDCEQI
jgi:hypothetical protein